MSGSQGVRPVHDQRTITVHLPLVFKRRGGRKLVVAPDGADWAPPPKVDNAMVKALARAFRWRRLLETGAYGTVAEIAAAEKVNASYVCRILRIALLAPNLVEEVLAGRQTPHMTIAALQRPFPREWSLQRAHFARPARSA